MKDGIQKLDILNMDNVKGTTVLDFYADWCGPCKAIMPILEDISSQGGARMIKINVEDASDGIIERYDIMSIPRIIIWRDGVIVGDFTGPSHMDDIEKIIKST